MRRSPNGTREQVPDLVLQHPIGRQPNRIAVALGFEELVNLGVGEGGIGSEVPALHRATIRVITGSSTSRQPSALWTFPDRRALRSRSPNWLNTNNGCSRGSRNGRYRRCPPAPLRWALAR